MDGPAATLPDLPEGWHRALCVVAHPDDLEYGAASAVARWTGQGKDVRYLLATRGEAGIEAIDPVTCARIRSEEQVRSAAVVGVEVVEFLDHPDGAVVEGLALRRDLAAAIRRHRPEAVVGLNHHDTFASGGWNHADHRAVGRSLIDAVRDAANPWVFPELRVAGLEPWSGVQLTCFANAARPTHVVDVAASLDSGVASLREHRTYLEHLPPGTLGTDPDAFLRGAAAEAGRAVGREAVVPFEVVA